jgi:glutamyl-Q tRNA(Asp) synthetase
VNNSPVYIGRFAPSPSGPLHLGSLLAATASYLDAKANKGQWLVRIEDIDPPREQAGASELILQSLQDHGLFWDGDVLFQSQRSNAYEDALAQLANQNQLFYCTCTRAQLSGQSGYPGTCREQLAPPEIPAATRLKCHAENYYFEDGIQGPQHWELSNRDDTILKRKDGLYGYQLAVVVDDAAQGINHVVRGIDLLDSTVKQLYLYKQLGLTPPAFSHIPIIIDENGNKLSKQNHATAIHKAEATKNLLTCLRMLNQPLPPLNYQDTCQDILAFAIDHWDLKRVKGTSVS